MRKIWQRVRQFFCLTRDEILEERRLPDYTKDDPEPQPVPEPPVPLRYRCWKCDLTLRRLKAKRLKFRCPQCNRNLIPIQPWNSCECAKCGLEFPETMGSCPRCDETEQKRKARRPIPPPPPEPREPPDITNDEIWKRWNSGSGD